MLTLSLSLSILLSQAAAVRRSTPAADDPGMVVRQVGAITISGTIPSGDGGNIGQVSQGPGLTDGGTWAVTCIGCTGGSGAAWVPDGGLIGYMRMPDGGALEVYTVNSGGPSGSVAQGAGQDGGAWNTTVNELRGVGQSSWAPDPSNIDVPGAGAARFDISNNLMTRAQILTDEGSFSYGFPGTSLATVLTGTPSFTAGVTTVTGVGTLFTAELSKDSYIAIAAHGETALTRVSSIVSDTELELGEGYLGATASGVSIATFFKSSTPAGASFSVAGGEAQGTNATTNGALFAYWRDVDYGPLQATIRMNLTARLSTQTIFFGYADTVPDNAPNQRATFVFDGTDASTVICRTSNIAGVNLDTTVTIPNGSSTSANHNYEIHLAADRVTFVIDGVLMATHQALLPGPYTVMKLTVSTDNTALTVAPATVAVSWIQLQSLDRVDVLSTNPVAARFQAQVQGANLNGAPISTNPVITGGSDSTNTARTLRLNIDGETVTTGSQTNNATVAASSFSPTLPAVATAAAPAYNEGRMVTHSTDLNGALRVTGAMTSTASQGVGLDGGQAWNVGGTVTAQQGPGQDGGAWNVYVLNQSGSAAVVAGALTNNNAAPSTDNLGVLPARANAAAPSWTEGNQVLLSTDLTGALRVSSSAAGPSTQGIGIDGGQAWNVNGEVNTTSRALVVASNSSTATLGIGAAFTGTAIDMLDYSTLRVSVYADQNSATDGWQVQFSNDSTNWDFIRKTSYVTSATGGNGYVIYNRVARYARVVFTNGGTGQGAFRLQTMVVPNSSEFARNFLSEIPVASSGAIVTQSVIVGTTTAGGGAYVPVKVNPSGALTVDVSGTVDTRLTFDAGWVSVANIQRNVVVDGGTISVNNIERWGGQPMGTLVPVGFDGGWVSVGNTVTVTGTVATGALTDAQLRATPVPVSGTVTANAGTNLNTSALFLDATFTGRFMAGASLTDNFANPTTTGVGAFNLLWDGATWDRAPGTSADGMLVNLGANNDVTVTGSVTASGTVTANQGTPVATASRWPVQLTDGTDLSLISAGGALLTDSSATTQPVSGTFWQATQPVSGTVTANAGTNLNTSALLLDATFTGRFAAGAAASDNFANPTTTGMLGFGMLWDGATWDRMPGTSALGVTMNLSSISGTALTLGQKAMTASVPVVLASDQASIPVTLTSTTITGTAAVTQSGTWTVQPGNTPNTAPWLTTDTPRTVASANNTGTCTTVGVTNVTVLASNASRKAYGFKAADANTVTVFCKLGATATVSNMPFGKGAAWSQDTGAVYTGVIDCISGSAAQTVCAYELN